MKILDHFEQQSPEWFDARIGLITMSHAAELLAGGKGKTRATYLRSVVAEILAGRQGDEYQSTDMIRGNELEPYAIRAYEDISGVPVSRVGLVIHDDPRIGCSPDGLTSDAGVEIKCPRPKQHLFYMDRDAVIAAHGPQIQGQMWICERDRWDFVSFCPWVREMPIIIHTIHCHEPMIVKLAESAMRGADEVAAMVYETRGMPEPTIETQAHAQAAIEYWEALSIGVSSEVKL